MTTRRGLLATLAGALALGGVSRPLRRRLTSPPPESDRASARGYYRCEADVDIRRALLIIRASKPRDPR